MTGDLVNSLVLLGIAGFNAFTAFMAWRTLGTTKRIEKNVQTVETATNSMKDALVVAAGKEGFRKGVDAEKADPGTAKNHSKEM